MNRLLDNNEDLISCLEWFFKDPIHQKELLKYFESEDEDTYLQDLVSDWLKQLN